LIAKALGAKVTKALVKEIGWYNVSLTRFASRDPCFSGFPKTFPVFQWHGDTFEVPNRGKLIATSPALPHQAFRYGTNVYGLQFHLEVTREMIQEWMETYEDEFAHHPPRSRNEIMIETETMIEIYTRRGMNFFINFFSRIADRRL
jgi:GMP synthase-like glutamine amidotransferase